jgi:formamidopyrimidine-DNA glycosylase
LLTVDRASGGHGSSVARRRQRQDGDNHNSGMPEMPEVEVTRLGLVSRIRGARVESARLGKPLRHPLGLAVEELAGWSVGEMARRGKYLWLPLVRAEESAGLLVHLGMSGSLALVDDRLAAGPHDHFDLVTDKGMLRLTDPRRFGAVVWSAALSAEPAARLLARLGAEAFDPALTARGLHDEFQRRRAPVKTVLLGGEVIVGAGNIYVSEALFASGIDPRSRCDSLSRRRCDRLLAQLRSILAQAISAGGSTLRDFRDSHGRSGAFQDQAQVYGREGLPCFRCAESIRRIVIAQRSSYYCPRCQKP